MLFSLLRSVGSCCDSVSIKLVEKQAAKRQMMNDCHMPREPFCSSAQRAFEEHFLVSACAAQMRVVIGSKKGESSLWHNLGNARRLLRCYTNA